jgi:small subunit ribosomal protein S21
MGRGRVRKPGLCDPGGPAKISTSRTTNIPGSRTGVRNIVQVIVRDNNVDQALRALKKKMQREGVFREMKLRRAYEKPSERKARERAEAVRRYRKLMRKRMEREGY